MVIYIEQSQFSVPVLTNHCTHFEENFISLLMHFSFVYLCAPVNATYSSVPVQHCSPSPTTYLDCYLCFGCGYTQIHCETYTPVLFWIWLVWEGFYDSGTESCCYKWLEQAVLHWWPFWEECVKMQQHSWDIPRPAWTCWSRLGKAAVGADKTGWSGMGSGRALGCVDLVDLAGSSLFCSSLSFLGLVLVQELVQVWGNALWSGRLMNG